MRVNNLILVIACICYAALSMAQDLDWEYGRNDFFIVVHPNHWELFPEILNWGVNIWGKGKNKISTEIYTFGQQKIEQFLAAGFHAADGRRHRRTRNTVLQRILFHSRHRECTGRFSDDGICNGLRATTSNSSGFLTFPFIRSMGLPNCEQPDNTPRQTVPSTAIFKDIPIQGLLI